MLRSFKNFLEILCCIIIGLGIGFLSHWQNETIQMIYSTLILILLLIGFIKVVISPKEYDKQKKNIIKEKDSNLIKFIIKKQKPIKAIELSQNPTQDGEILGEIFLETMKGGKRIMRWLKSNKGAIISGLTILLGLLESVFDFLYQYIPFDFGFNFVGIVITLIGGISAILTSGLGSTKFKEAIAQLKDQLNGDTTDLQYISSVKYIERQIMTYEKSVLTIEKDIEALSKKYAKTISEYTTCSTLGLPFDEEVVNSYNSYQNELEELTKQLNSKNSALQTYRNKLAQLQK